MAAPSISSPRKEFKLEKPAIGKGTYGKVYRAKWVRLNTESMVAVKVFPLDAVHSRNAFEAESRMSVLLQDNPHCATIKKAYISNNKGYLVMTLFRGDVMDIQSSLEYNEEASIPIFYNICKAIQLLHRKRIVHLDIKPDNILLDNKNQPFLADFGSSAVIPLGGRYTKPVGTVEFAAPEVLSGELYSPFPADVWSLGVLLYTMLTGKYPKIKKGVYSPNNKLSNECNRFLTEVLQKKPSLRPDINVIVDDEWFQTFGCIPILLPSLRNSLKTPLSKPPKSARKKSARKSKSPRNISQKLKNVTPSNETTEELTDTQ